MTASPQRSADGARALEQRFVTSQDLFDQETKRIFGRQWLCVAHQQQLESVGGALPIEIEQQQLVLVRDEVGKIRAFRNVCRHRGCQLVTASHCLAHGQSVRCPYHGWTYDRQGRLQAAPHMAGTEGFDPQQYGLLEVPTEVYGGLIWIHQSPRQSLEEYLAPLAGQFADWSTEKLRVVAVCDYDVAANWKLLFQNYSECYHCPGVHPALNRLTPFQGASNQLASGPILGGPMQLAAGCQTMSETGDWVGSRLPQLDDVQARCVHYFTLFPSMFLSTHPDYVLIHLIQRTSVERTHVKCLFLFHPDAVDAAEFEVTAAVGFWDRVNREDWEVCELAQAGMQSEGYRPGPYSALESVVAAFDRHYYQTLELEAAADGRDA
ncbi:MAG TPA: hypothetical protein DCY79_00280 [Planctomycetaceae bacterium]|nr:hypothetical protein [Planctomycetaceae bacterium]